MNENQNIKDYRNLLEIAPFSWNLNEESASERATITGLF
jgi:hypothetical protein